MITSPAVSVSPVLMVTRLLYPPEIPRATDSAEAKSDGDGDVPSWPPSVVYLLFIALPLVGIVMMYNRGSDWFLAC